MKYARIITIIYNENEEISPVSPIFISAYGCRALREITFKMI